MYRIVVALCLLLVSGSLFAKPRSYKQPVVTSTATELSQQVASLVSYPAIMREGNHAGIVVVTFSVSETNRLSKLTVHTDNRELNDDLTRQLVGKKVRLVDNNPFETYTVRLRFVR